MGLPDGYNLTKAEADLLIANNLAACCLHANLLSL